MQRPPSNCPNGWKKPGLDEVVMAGTKRMLVVEDDRAIAELIKHHFSKEGFTVTSTPSGEEALVLVEEIRPALVVLDWMVEDVSGIEVCRRLRRTAASSNIPIMMLTRRRGASARRVTARRSSSHAPRRCCAAPART